MYSTKTETLMKHLTHTNLYISCKIHESNKIVLIIMYVAFSFILNFYHIIIHSVGFPQKYS